MADNVKQTKKILKIEERITFEKREQLKIDNERALLADVEVSESSKLEDIVKSRKKQEQELRKEYRTGARDLQKDVDDLKKRKEAGEKIDGRTIRGLEQQIVSKKQTAKTDKDALFIQQEKTELLNQTIPIIENQASGFKDIADSVEGFVKNLPGGQFLSDAIGLTGFGDKLQKEVTEEMANHILKTGDATTMLSAGFSKAKTMITGVVGQAKMLAKTLMKMLMANPFLALVVAAVALFKIIKNVRSMQRKFANEIGISRDEVGLLAVKTKLAEKSFNAIGLDGSKIQGSLKEIVSEFGSLENMTVANAMNIERFAQNAGVSSSEVVKLNKAFMDLDGLSFDAATNVSKTAVGLAKAAGVSTAKVIGDMSSSAAAFARFSMEGADGFARAAVEAAKVGANLSGILEAADSLLKFETSISDQFEAQVLTGKMINTERARQLALDGDIAGLTTEIQSIVGGVGDIQSLNVIQRKSVADAIGISVSDLLKISRGEQVAATETVQDLQKRTNDILIEGLDVSREQLGITKDNKTVNINTPIT